MFNKEKKDLFEEDPFPGKPKILFIGLAHSSHTHGWINLLKESEFNIRLFSTAESLFPPSFWNVRTYVSAKNFSTDTDSPFRKYFYPPLNSKLKRLYNQGFLIIPRSENIFRLLIASLALLFFSPIRLVEKITGRKNKNKLVKGYIQILGPEMPSLEDWLAKIIQEWQPDIIHTLGIFDGQGGEFYYFVRKKYNLEGYGKWITDIRGGSDITLRRHDPAVAPQLFKILSECDQISGDNLVIKDYASQMGITTSKFASIVPVPGNGGVDIDQLAALNKSAPSTRRLILVPKAYESIWSKAVPILEGIQLAWDKIQPCELVFLAVNPEVRTFFYALPDQIRQNCRIEERIPHLELLEIMGKARVMVAPSLVDGVPNVLLEAMASEVFPIVSPLETITPIVENEKNVLFAHNLNSQEIATALIRAMNDDDLVDVASVKNLYLVRKYGDKKVIQPRVIEYYNHLILQSKELT